MRGFFVTLEGPEGAGKSTQARRLASALRRGGREAVLVRDPGSTALGRRLRHVLLHARLRRCPAVAEALLFVAARVALVEERIAPALARGAVVVCDRFHDSTVAYQGFGGGVPVAWLNRLGRDAIGGVMPRLTVLLDLPSKDGLARRPGRRDRMERKAREFHERVRRGFLTLAKREPRRFIVIDASQDRDAVHRQIVATVAARLKRVKAS